MNEVRVTNETTGGEKGQKLARFDLVPVGPLRALAEHYGRGSEKYADRNWEKGVDWSLNYAALMRHVTAWWAGEDDDPETGTSHLAAVAWHAFALLEYRDTHPELDDRPNTAFIVNPVFAWPNDWMADWPSASAVPDFRMDIGVSNTKSTAASPKEYLSE